MQTTASIARYHVVHETTYRYESPVSLSHQHLHLHLSPRDCPWQSCTAHRLDIAPQPTLQRTRFDSFGNPVTELAIEAAHSELFVRAESHIEGRPHLPVDGDAAMLHPRLLASPRPASPLAGHCSTPRRS